MSDKRRARLEADGTYQAGSSFARSRASLARPEANQGKSPGPPVSDQRVNEIAKPGRKRCPRSYKTRESAARSKIAGKPGAVVTECRVCPWWHVRFPDRAKRKPLKAVSVGKAAKPSVRSVGAGSVSWKRIGSGLKPFPRKVALLITERDEFCQRCGSAGPLHKHHRRAKGMGGDERAHTQAACNGILLCAVDVRTGEIGGCHRYVHLHPAEAKAQGFIVEQDAEPCDVGVMRYCAAEGAGGALQWPTCSGVWAETAPESREAA